MSNDKTPMSIANFIVSLSKPNVEQSVSTELSENNENNVDTWAQWAHNGHNAHNG